MFSSMLLIKKNSPIPIPGASQGYPSGGNNIGEIYFLEDFVICCHLTPHPNPRRQSKFPSGENKYRNRHLFSGVL